jgi:hypothetical protein
MNSSLVLTTFLTVSGVFTFWCSLKNYDWFFNFPGPSRLFIVLVGRPVSRVVYLLFSMGLTGWGVARIVDPPPKIPTDFIYELAAPGGIDLTKGAETTTALRQHPGLIRELHTDKEGWVSFRTRLDPHMPFFQDAVASTEAGPDFHEGFAFRRRSYGEMKLEGRVIYFDPQLVSCDNFLFSSHPLSSASFAMVICTPETSRENGFEDSLSVFYCRAGTPWYKKLFR